MPRNLSDEDIDAIVAKMSEPQPCATEEEKEWLHTASTYIPKKHLQTLGKIVGAVEDTATEATRMVVRFLFWGAFFAIAWIIAKKNQII